jgi:hypothetical protein
MHSLLKPMHSLLKPMHSLLKPMHSLLKPMHSLLKPLTHPYRVLVVWGDRCIKHYAMTYDDALSWAACYDLEALVLIRSRRGRLLGLRIGSVDRYA